MHRMLFFIFSMPVICACGHGGSNTTDSGSDGGSDAGTDSDADTDTDTDTGWDPCGDEAFPPANEPDGCTRTLLSAVDGVAFETSSIEVSISTDGSLALFTVFDSAHSMGTGVSGDDNGVDDVYAVDLDTLEMEIISLSDSGQVGDGASWEANASADGRFVVFTSSSADLDDHYTAPSGGVYLRDRNLGDTELVSLSHQGAAVQGGNALVSDDGGVVVFRSWDDSVVSGDDNGKGDLFARDRVAGTTTRISVTDGGAQIEEHAMAPAGLSTDGRYVLFSHQSALVAADDDGTDSSAKRIDVYLYDRQSGQPILISRAPDGFSDANAIAMELSPDGHRVVFRTSGAEHYCPQLPPDSTEIIIADISGTEPTYEPLRHQGENTGAFSDTNFASLTADGRYFAFMSLKPDLVAHIAPEPVAPSGYLANAYVLDREADTVALVTANDEGRPGIVPYYESLTFSIDFVGIDISDDGKRTVFATIQWGIVEDTGLPCSYVMHQVYLRECP